MSILSESISNCKEKIEPLLTTAQVAERTGFPKSTIRNKANAGEIEHFRFSGKCMRFQWSSVMAWLESKKVSNG